MNQKRRTPRQPRYCCECLGTSADLIQKCARQMGRLEAAARNGEVPSLKRRSDDRGPAHPDGCRTSNKHARCLLQACVTHYQGHDARRAATGRLHRAEGPGGGAERAAAEEARRAQEGAASTKTLTHGPAHPAAAGPADRARAERRPDRRRRPPVHVWGTGAASGRRHGPAGHAVRHGAAPERVADERPVRRFPGLADDRPGRHAHGGHA